MASGILFFLHLSPRVAGTAFDGDVYSIPHDQGWTSIAHESEVRAFNELQMLNAVANLYFRDWNHRDWIAKAAEVTLARRAVDRHRVTLSVFDTAEGDYERFKVIDPAELKEGDRALAHSEHIMRMPTSWPRLPCWHPKGVVFTNDTRAGFVREGQLQYRDYGGFSKVPAHPK